MAPPASTPVLCYARIRPALEREIDGDNRLSRCLAKQPGAPILHVATKPGAPVVIEADGTTSSDDLRTFELDGCFEEGCDTASVHATAAAPLVEGVLDGVNATLLCYGMTGSGKSHTMLGDTRHDGLVGLVRKRRVVE